MNPDDYGSSWDRLQREFEVQRMRRESQVGWTDSRLIQDVVTGCYAPIDLIIATQNARARSQSERDERERERERREQEEHAERRRKSQAARKAREEAARKAAEEKERKIQERIERNRRLKEREEAVRQIEAEAEHENWDASVIRFRLLDLD